MDETSSRLRIRALRSPILFLVDGWKRPIRLKSFTPAWRAMAFLASSISASMGSSMEAGSFRRGFLGADTRER